MPSDEYIKKYQRQQSYDSLPTEDPTPLSPPPFPSPDKPNAPIIQEPEKWVRPMDHDQLDKKSKMVRRFLNIA